MENNNGYYKGKHAVVTGSASGVGLALCEELLAQGAGKVVLSDINAERLKREKERLSQTYPGQVEGFLCDVSREQDVHRMIDDALGFMDGRLDLLINNAGLALGGMFAATDDSAQIASQFNVKVQSNEDWQHAFAVNFYGALYGCREAIRVMIPQGGGQVINIISGIAFSPMAYQSMYAATKAALNMLTLTLRYEYWENGIKFNSATPGTTQTPIWQNVGGAPDSAQSPQQSAQRVLREAAQNRRLILGDDADADGAAHCFDPNAAEALDAYFLNVARSRKSGKMVI